MDSSYCKAQPTGRTSLCDTFCSSLNLTIALIQTTCCFSFVKNMSKAPQGICLNTRLVNSKPINALHCPFFSISSYRLKWTYFARIHGSCPLAILTLIGRKRSTSISLFINSITPLHWPYAQGPHLRNCKCCDVIRSECTPHQVEERWIPKAMAKK